MTSLQLCVNPAGATLSALSVPMQHNEIRMVGVMFFISTGMKARAT